MEKYYELLIAMVVVAYVFGVFEAMVLKAKVRAYEYALKHYTDIDYSDIENLKWWDLF